MKVFCLALALTTLAATAKALPVAPEIRGLNAGTRLKYSPYIPWHGDEALSQMNTSGLHFLRLPLQWAAIEPTPGQYDEAYLDRLEAWVTLANQHGVQLILDMHQDTYSAALGGNGAPAWATMPTASGSLLPIEDLPWFFQYLDRKVMTAFDSFWANRTVPATGLGLQDHYARMYAHVARRFSQHPNVIGYDLMNEPFYGSEFEPIALRVIRKNWWHLAKHSLLSLFHGVDVTDGLIESLRDPDALDRFLSAADPLVQTFETDRLMPFYDRVARAIRSEHKEALLFIEATPLKIQGGRSFLRKPVDEAGVPFEGVVFAPHYYDPTTLDGWKPFDGNTERLRRSISRSADEARRMGVPLVFGEWGNFSKGLRGAQESIAAHQALFKEFGAGSLYWAFEPDFPASAYWGQLAEFSQE